VLSYELVRKVLRDSQFRMPKGVALAAQGITSGPAPWKPLIGITGPTILPIEFDAGH